MARAGVCLALLLGGCGLASKDFDVEQPFRTGGLPSSSGSFESSSLTGPLSGDVSRISSVTLKAARIESTDNNGDISFISGATLSVAPAHGPVVLLASLPAPPAAGQTSVQLLVTGTELKPYLLAGATIAASINYSQTQVNARELKLVLTLHGSLL